MTPHLPPPPRGQTGSQNRLLGSFLLLFPPYRALVLPLLSNWVWPACLQPPSRPRPRRRLLATTVAPTHRANFERNFQTSKAAAVSAVFALGAPAGRLRLDLRPRHLIFVIAPPRFMVRSPETPPCAEIRAICINQQRGRRARVIRSVNPTQVTT